ncbi:hypothetical protein MTO96_046484 [Rhipicephalus appendiculatus]
MALKYWFVFAAVLHAGQWLIITGEESSTPDTTEEYDYGGGAPVTCLFINSTLGLLAPNNCSLVCLNGTDSFNATSPNNASCLLDTGSAEDGIAEQVQTSNCSVGRCLNGTCHGPGEDAECC